MVLPRRNLARTVTNVDFEGTFQSVPGTYTCTGMCTPDPMGPDDMGMLSMLTGTWTFTATDTDAMIAGVNTDDDYLDFGYWIQTETAEDDGAETYMVSAFARGSDPYGTVAGVEGSATYTGGAAGLYSRSSDRTAVGGGPFTAAVTLKAYFSDARP